MIEDISRTVLRRDGILLTDKVALVTGGGTGIGRGIAIGLAEFGADVAVLDIDSAAAEQVAGLIRAKGCRALVLNANVTDRDAARAAVSQAVAELGALDILVNNVGGTRPIKLVDMTDRQADRQIELNLNSLVTMTQAAAKAMIAGGRGGCMINITSIEGTRAAPAYAVYAACKAGMINFTRSMALELAGHAIRVNAIAPDIVLTEAVIRIAPGLASPEAEAARARRIPLVRAGNYDDCAGAAVFLASGMASYITGITLNVDGGTWASSGWARDDDGGWRLYS
jgi:NAD(P)-dependent dehydrogenase (short-subunit alcohol dehydrogenase family)